MREIDLAWAAGIVDGEGSIGVYSGGRHGTRRVQYALRLSVVNCDPRMLLRLREMFGGGLKPRTNVRRNKWEWAVYSTSAGRVIKMLQPYLVCKADQAALALEFASTLDRNGVGHSQETNTRREEIRQQMKVLKHFDHQVAS